MKKISHFIGKIFRPRTCIQTFTYFVPAPPERKTSYREKEFDKVLNQILAQGHQLHSITTQVLTRAKGSGMWIILAFETDNRDKYLADLAHIENDFENSQSQPSVEGLYYIED